MIVRKSQHRAIAGELVESTILDKYVMVHENPDEDDTKEQGVRTSLYVSGKDSHLMVTISAEGVRRTYYFPIGDCEVAVSAGDYGDASWDDVEDFRREVIRNEMGINDVDDDE